MHKCYKKVGIAEGRKPKGMRRKPLNTILPDLVLYGLVLLIGQLDIIAQDIHYQHQDSLKFHEILQATSATSASSLGELMVSSGKSLLKTPYVAKTLEIEGPEQLVVNFRGLDCTTFVENTLAIARTSRMDKGGWLEYLEELQSIRYRKGALEGYPSRLHYFSEWLRDNEAKGLIRIISSELGGSPISKTLDFMGTHPEFYPQLSDSYNLSQIREIEQRNSEKEICIVSLESLEKAQNQLRNGDIIALATKINGLDVTHTGLIYVDNKKVVRLLHASASGEVLISSKPLLEYLKGIKSLSGVMVARPL